MRKIFLAVMALGAILASLPMGLAQSSGKSSYRLSVNGSGNAKIKLESGQAKWVTRSDSGFGADFTGASHLEVGGDTLTVSLNQGTAWKIEMDVEVDSAASTLTIWITDRTPGGKVSISAGAKPAVDQVNNSGRMEIQLK